MIKNLLLILTIFILAACSNQKPEEVAKKYLENYHNGNADAVIDVIYFPDVFNITQEQKDALMKQNVPFIREGVRQQGLLTIEKGGIDNIEVLSTQCFDKVSDPSKKLCTVELKIYFKNSTTWISQVHLSQTSDGWKVNMRL